MLSKYVLIHAGYGDRAAIRKLVFTGSHNLTGAALRRNDEAMLRLGHPAIYEVLWDNWNTIRAQ